MTGEVVELGDAVKKLFMYPRQGRVFVVANNSSLEIDRLRKFGVCKGDFLVQFNVSSATRFTC
jgi:hypothetical protein